MAYKSTAKQRLWLSCLDYRVSTGADSEEVSSLFEDLRRSDRYQQPVTDGQLRLANTLGIAISRGEACGDAAGKLYQLLLCRAWVFSVWRAISGSSATKYDETGLSQDTALGIAREMVTMELGAQLEQFSTTDAREGDVFYRISKKAQSSQAFRFASERLTGPAPDATAVAASHRADVGATLDAMQVSTHTVRCPNCQATISFVEEGVSQRVVCNQCRSQYTLRRRQKPS